MKIGIITYSLNSGGVSTFIFSLGKYFVDQGHSVEIITEEQKGVWFDNVQKYGLKSSFSNYGIYPWLPFGSILYANKVGRFINNKMFDVVILNYCLYAQIAAGIYNDASVISVVHNVNKGVFQVAARNIDNIDKIVCVSQAVYNGMASYIKTEKLCVIPNGIDLPIIQPIFPKPLNGLLNIIFVGHLDHKQKGVLFIPEILVRIKSKGIKVHLSIVGDGKDKKLLKKQFKEFDIEEFATFYGVIPKEKVYDLYISSHIFLMPSFYEGLPLTLIESMSCGCVPVVSLLDNITDFCIDDKIDGFLCKVSDVESFADNIIKLAMDTDLLNKMGKNSELKARRQFSIQRMGSEYTSLMNSIKKNELKRSKFSISWRDFFPQKIFLLKTSIKTFFKI